MSVVTFDWGQINAFSNSPLLTPWWSAANTGFSLIFFYWFLLPILYVSLHVYFSHIIYLKLYAHSTPMFGTVLTYP
jgi:OPT oligopeptide transporter protein